MAYQKGRYPKGAVPKPPMPNQPPTQQSVLAKRHNTNSQDTKRRQAKRKYAANSSQWRKIRDAQLAREPLCIDCTRQHKTTPANTVDHIDGNSHNNQQTNLQSMCASCHSKKTIKQDGGLGRLKRKGRGNP